MDRVHLWETPLRRTMNWYTTRITWYETLSEITGRQPQSRISGSHHQWFAVATGRSQRPMAPETPPSRSIGEGALRFLMHPLQNTPAFSAQSHADMPSSATQSVHLNMGSIGVIFLCRRGLESGRHYGRYNLCPKRPFHRPSIPQPEGHLILDAGTSNDCPDENGANSLPSHLGDHLAVRM